MANRNQPDDQIDGQQSPPIVELSELTLADDPEFPRRVKRSLNRYLLMGDSLEFSLDIFQKTMWEYVKTMVELWPPQKGDKLE